MACELVNESKPRDRTPEMEDLEFRASRQLVVIIDILLGLTLVEGALAYRSMFTQGSDANVPAIVAMVLIYYTAVRSFIDWHIAMEVRPYRILTKDTRSHELGRVFLDFAIMASYSFLLLRAHVLIANPGADLVAIAVTYVGIYLAYLAWGQLRQGVESVGVARLPQFGCGLLLVAIGIAAALLVLYIVGRGQGWLGLSQADFNTAFLVLELVLLAWYRHKNWSQQVILKVERVATKTVCSPRKG